MTMRIWYIMDIARSGYSPLKKLLRFPGFTLDYDYYYDILLLY